MNRVSRRRFVERCALAAIASAEASGQTPVPQEFYVSLSGSDGNNGSRNRPFATLARARDAIRAARKLDPRGRDFTVWIRGGIYRLREPVVFGLEDSAPPGHSITYGAAAGEDPVFSSGVSLLNWRKAGGEHAAELPPAARGKVWVADLPEHLGRFHALFDRDGHLPRARSAGFVPRLPPGSNGNLDPARRSESLRTLYSPPGVIRNWPNLDDIELVIRPSIRWTMNILALQSVDERSGTAVTQLPASYPLLPIRGTTGDSAWVENVMEALDGPGEWVLNTHTRKLYLWPRQGEPDETIVAPGLRELIRIEGKVDVAGPSDTPVRGLVFDGLTFAHADRVLWEAGDKGMQHDWEMEDKPDALVRLRGAEDCVIRNCRFKDSGGNAVRLDYHAQGNRVEGNEIRNLGQGGIILFGYGPGTKDVNRRNQIVNNHIHHSGLLYWHSHGIVLWQSGENRVANNHIHDMPRKAICLAGARYTYFRRPGSVREVASTFRWHEIGEPPSSFDQALRFLHTRNNVIEDNEVSQVLQKLGDGAAINVSGAGEGNVIRHNYVHDVTPSEWVAAILRNDDWQRGTTWENNVIFRVHTRFGQNKGVNHIINNIAVDTSLTKWPDRPDTYLAFLSVMPAQPVDGARIERNIFYNSQPAEANFIAVSVSQNSPAGSSVPAVLARMKVDYNTYFNASVPAGAPSKFKDLMRESGAGQHDAYEDPLFANVESGDFRLRPASPALARGFQPIDLKGVGLTSRFRKRLLE